ncbi:MAG: hypothetical protein EXR62_15635 [Chloroflexi bacterium]|nr:hypothetical protein [Chloroflexota bacterium]
MPTNLYEITLPSKVKIREFEKFMLEEVFPAVGRGPTRVGSVKELRLLKDIKVARKYFWTIEWDGLRLFEGFVEAPFEKLKAYGANVELLGTL